MNILRSTSIVALASLTLSAFAQNLSTNPGFETGDFTGWSTMAAATGSDFGVGSGARTGSFAARFSANSDQPDSISQTIPTVVGEEYTLTYYLKDTSTIPLANKAFGATLGTSTEVIVGAFGNVYTAHELKYIAASALTSLSFSAYNLNGNYFLDDIMVTGAAAPPVPEPGTVAALGLGALGILRRKTRKA